MKSAFTMIELIFVIVILGILAAVAIPKLSATRDDAKVASMADSIKNVVSEVVSSSVAKGNADSNLSDMSYTIERMIGLDYASLTDPNTVEFKIGTVQDCVRMQKSTVVQDVNLTVTYAISTDPRCNQLQRLVNMEQYQIPLQGERIEY